MSHTPISSDEEVYLSDPPSDLDTDAKTEDDYEYHPANQDSFVNSPAVSVKVTPRGGFGEGVSVLIEGGGVTAPSTNGHSPRSVHSAPPHDHERESGASSSCPIDVAAILERATRSESGVEGSAGDKHLPQGAASSPVPAAGPPVGLGVRPGAASNGNGPSLPPRPSGTGTEAGSAPRPDQPGSAFAAEMAAQEAEAAGEPLDFGAVVLVIGLRGTGKSATIDSLLGRRVSLERGEVAGLRLTFIDTPGLEASAGAASRNAATLRAIRRAFDAHKPHAVLYVDRLDASRRDASELHALHAVSDTLGADAWFSTLLCVTHALAPPPDGASGQPLGQDAYLQNRQQQLVQVMRAVAGDSRMMNPVALVENSPACARGAGGEPVLPNGVAWRRHLLMLCATTRVLNEASTLLKPGRGAKSPPGGARAPPGFGGGSMKVPPMAWLLAKLVEFRAPRKFPEDERELMRDDEIAGLPPAQREFQLRRRRVYLRQRADEARGEENAVPILAPEPALGPSFDPEVNNHRYRVLESPKALLTRPVIGEGGVDHEDGIDSVQVEKSAILRKRTQFLGGVPTLSWVQVQKDKNSLTFQGESDAALYHSTYWVSYASVNAQSLQRDVLYTGRLESRVRSKGKRQKFTVGLLASKLGEDFTLPPIKGGNGAYGLKLDERLRITDSIKLRAAVGRLLTKMGTHYEPGTAVAADLKLRNPADDSARLLLGGSAQWQGRDKRAAKQSLVMGGNIAGEVRLPKMDGTGMKSDTQVSANAQYTTRGQGTLALRINSHDVPQLAAIMLVPVLRAAWDKCFAREVEAF
ncbi:Translocase of chloroplast 159, chloroplastic [Auxenochlorella protothecoides]|uniref:Translocase of chloroplast 159, chloroplastic n=1 Tax=Auxenochlorella protothecoides TaxID=3075 RepID=A0A087SSY3_AUXPR|nr:Translocase of chloroplast 159, chloroplastic [Auxenochlorella protothecoides]KFM28837.1 Translocase of chloroplast 159, chloroplastic [Auxenochlorella protothecoides]